MNYIGSKHSLLSFLYNSIFSVTGGTKGIFIDGFAGTGSVGRHFQEKGFSVIANDIQYYSYVLNKGKLCIPRDMGKMEQVIAELNMLEGVEGFVYRNYCAGGTENDEFVRLYFTDENGKRCDAARQKIEEMHEEKTITEDEYFYLIYCLIEAIDKVANTASVYGAFLKKIKKSAAKKMDIQLLGVENIGSVGEVHNENVEEFVRDISGDILYLDPPYNQRQYAPNYHVLETIAKYDNPELRGKTGLRNYADQKSNFCSKAKVHAALDAMIESANVEYVFLSYSNEGLMTPESIQEIFGKYGECGFFTKDYGRFKADKTENRNHTASSVVEYLHWVKKKR